MGVNPKITRKMRDLAIRQALTELSETPSPGEVQYIARRHGLTFAELRGALIRSKQNEKKD